ncbi:MAG: FGGY family carbohydrate kinase [Actinomycetota bacterium]
MGNADLTVLALDVGTTAVKAGIVRGGAITAAASSSPLETSTPADGWVEQDADDWWAATVEAIAALPPADLDDVDVVAVTGQMQDLLCIDGTGHPVRPVILYGDTRADRELGELLHALPDWPHAVGRPPDPTAVAAKWRWLVDNEPNTVAATRHVVFGAGGEVVRRLTGAVMCDHTTASTTGMYELSARSWWPPIAKIDDLPVPPLDDRRPWPMLPTFAEELGLPPTATVVLAPGDAAATTLGIVGTELDRAYAYLGTSGWVAAATDALPDTDGFVLPGLNADHWVVAAPLIAAGATVDWAREVLLGGIDHDELDALAKGVCAATAGVLALPHLDGQRLPIADATARVALVGMGRSTDRAVIAAAILESVAHALRQLAELVAPEGEDFLVCGGGSRSDTWCQTIADVTGRTVHRTDDEHASLLGAAIAAGAESSPRPTTGSFPPDPLHHWAHRGAAAMFDALGPALRLTTEGLADLRNAADDTVDSDT